MKSIQYVAVGVAAAALMLSCSAPAVADSAIATVHDSEKDAAYSCPKGPTTPALASELEAADWDKNKLACAADAWFALSNASPQDRDTALHAMLATTAYINHVNAFWNRDVFGIRGPEWLLRVGRASEHGKILESRLASLPGQDANILAARGLYRLAWSARLADTKTHYAESRAVMQLLNQAVSLDSKVLNGNALWELGRLYYELPEFSGGDTAKGRQLLDKAYRQSPKNPAILRYAAYVDAQEGDQAGAKAMLSQMLPIDSGSGGLQLLADQLKQAKELATRLGDSDLEKQLDDKRAKLLAQHPELLHRLPSAANMHEGVNPFTGKDY